jgi:hypothetical protein
MSFTPFSITASDTLSQNEHANALCVVNAAAGLTLTLPAASGTGNKYEVIIGTTVTSNSVVIQVANATDVMSGSCLVMADAGDSVVGFETASTSDTITMNGTTTAGIKGDRVVLQDVASGLWSVSMVASATGTEATPFSAAVS